MPVTGTEQSGEDDADTSDRYIANPAGAGGRCQRLGPLGSEQSERNARDGVQSSRARTKQACSFLPTARASPAPRPHPTHSRLDRGGMAAQDGPPVPRAIGVLMLAFAPGT